MYDQGIEVRFLARRKIFLFSTFSAVQASFYPMDTGDYFPWGKTVGGLKLSTIWCRYYEGMELYLHSSSYLC
jgi:hypothetical protein